MVLDSPVIPQTGGVVFRAPLFVADEVAHFAGGFVLQGSLTVAQADSGQAGPVAGLANACATMQDRIATILVAAVAALACLKRVMLPAGKVTIQPLPQPSLDSFQRVGLVFLRR